MFHREICVLIEHEYDKATFEVSNEINYLPFAWNLDLSQININNPNMMDISYALWS